MRFVAVLIAALLEIKARQLFPDEGAELSELEPVTMSEVGTKLDLARAYMDMGDPADPAGAPTNIPFANRKEGGEVGKVPPGMSKALICMFAGSNATFTYTAG